MAILRRTFQVMADFNGLQFTGWYASPSMESRHSPITKHVILTALDQTMSHRILDGERPKTTQRIVSATALSSGALTFRYQSYARKMFWKFVRNTFANTA